MALLKLSAHDRTVLHESKPVIFTVLINRVGSIGLSLIPVLLVEKHITDAQSSAVLSSIRVTLVLGTLTAGWFVDRVGARITVLAALLLQVIGLGLLPFVPTALLIAMFGMFAQYGDGLMRICFRVLLTDTVPYGHHKQAMGWLRTANNAGQILSFSLGTVAGALGTLWLFLMDSVTSLVAFFYGLKILPRTPVGPRSADKPSASAKQQEHISVFILCAIIFSGYTFFYELYMSATAGRLELLYPGRGLRYFSIAMVINVLACSLFSVPAAKYFQRPSRVFPAAMLLTLCASCLSIGFTHSLWAVFLGATFISSAELAMMALSQFTLVRLTPNSKYSNTWYSAGLTLTHSGRIAAAAVAFPWFVQHQVQPYRFGVLAVICSLIAMFTYSVRRALDRATS